MFAFRENKNFRINFNFDLPAQVPNRVDTKWRFQFFAKYDYRFLMDVIIAIIATFSLKR
jgi:hypothetical protein